MTASKWHQRRLIALGKYHSWKETQQVNINVVTLSISVDASSNKLCEVEKDKLVFILVHDEVIIKLPQKQLGNLHKNFLLANTSTKI